MPDYEALHEIALESARAAAAVQRDRLGQVGVVDWTAKGVADFVTFVDREAEERAVEVVQARVPEHAILAEEGTVDGPSDERPEWLWLIDPLDGTTNYVHRYPMYAASVAVLRRGEPVAGAVVCGATGEEWTGWRGGGAWKDGRPIRVSGIERLDQALVGTGFPFRARELLPEYLRQLEAVIRHAAGVRRAGSAALDLCHLASGYLDGFWELVLAPWDVAAGTLLIREAGGIVTRLDETPGLLDAPGTVLAGNPSIHALLGERVRGA